MHARAVALIVVCAAIVSALPIDHEGAETVSLVEEGAVPHMRGEVQSFKATVEQVHDDDGVVGRALSEDYADDEETSKTLASLEADNEELGESEHNHELGESKEDPAAYDGAADKAQTDAEEAALKKAEAAAKATEEKEDTAIAKAKKSVKAKHAIEKMKKDTEATIKKAMAGLGVDTATKDSTKKLGEGKYDVKTSDDYEDKEEMKKLDNEAKKLKANLQKEDSSMTKVEENFKKSNAEKSKMEKSMSEFKKAAANAKKLTQDDDSLPTDELGETTVGDYSEEMNDLLHMSDEQPHGLTLTQARHLQEDYNRVASKYLAGIDTIVNGDKH